MKEHQSKPAGAQKKGQPQGRPQQSKPAPAANNPFQSKLAELKKKFKD
jgi:hypothetical protein